MDNVLPGIDFSEIINEEDDSGVFVDSNILESARRELEQDKIKIKEERFKPILAGTQRIRRVNDDEDMATKPAKKARIDENVEIPSPSKKRKCGHDSIRPVFDCIYWAKSNIVVEKLIQKNLANLWKDSDMTSLELSIKSK